MSLTEKSKDYIHSNPTMINIFKDSLSVQYELPSSSKEMQDKLLSLLPDNPMYIKVIKMKYYDGTITHKEHNQYKDKLKDFLPAKIFEYIFNADNFDNFDNLYNNLSNNDLTNGIIDETIDLWFLIDNDNENKNSLKEFIFILYCKCISQNCECELQKLEKIALEVYQCNSENTFFDNHSNLKEYFENLLNFITEDITNTKECTADSSVDHNKLENNQSTSTSDQDNWITNFVNNMGNRK